MNDSVIIMLAITIAVSTFTIVREMQKPFKVLHRYCDGTVVMYNYHNPPKNIKERLSK